MKQVYISHSTGFDYKNELYKPLKTIKGYNLIFPHKNDSLIQSDKIIKKCSALIAEVSTPSHGVGMEIGWAYLYEVPIIYIYKRGSKRSGSLKYASDNFIEYKRIEDIITKINKVLQATTTKK